MIKYLFLDIDGVLNGIDTMELDYRFKNYSFNDIDFKCLLYFNVIYKELNYPKIILISSWRHSIKLINRLNEAFKNFYNEKEDMQKIKLYDILDDGEDYSKKRPQLVMEYINNNNLKSEECLILDDEFNYEKLQHYKTDKYSGLENHDVIMIHNKYIEGNNFYENY